MREDRLQPYLRQLERQLRLRGIVDAESLEEIESHLRESVEAGLQRGLSPEDAERSALEHFGSAKLIARTFEKERKNIMQKILLGVAVLTGLFIAYIDSRPAWDDTGITVGTMLLASGLFTLLGYRRPWLIALAVGLWTPLYEMSFAHRLSVSAGLPVLLVVLIVNFIGAYTGWAARLGVRKTLHLA